MDEPWSTLTSDEVIEEFNANEKAAVDTTKSSDDLEGVVSRVIEQVRDAYRSGGRPLGDDGTVPSGLKPRAIAIARWNFIISIPGLQTLQTAERRGANEEAMRYLAMIAKREVKGGGSAQTIPAPSRQATRCRLDGLA